MLSMDGLVGLLDDSVIAHLYDYHLYTLAKGPEHSFPHPARSPALLNLVTTVATSQPAQDPRCRVNDIVNVYKRVNI